jgi:hypothetical protein
MTLKASTLVLAEIGTLSKKGDRQADASLQTEMQEHIDAWVNAGWQLHSFTSAPAVYSNTFGKYTTRHFSMWEPAEQAT